MGGGALILDRCRAFYLFASADAHLCDKVEEKGKQAASVAVWSQFSNNDKKVCSDVLFLCQPPGETSHKYMLAYEYMLLLVNDPFIASVMKAQMLKGFSVNSTQMRELDNLMLLSLEKEREIYVQEYYIGGKTISKPMHFQLTKNRR